MVHDESVENDENDRPPLQDAEINEVPNDVGLVNEGEQPIQEELPQTQLRESTRERQSSKKYSPNEYVMISDHEETKSC